MNNRYFKIILIFVTVVLVSGVFVGSVLAQATGGQTPPTERNLGKTIEGKLLGMKTLLGLPATVSEPTDVVYVVVKGLLGIIAIVFFVIILIAGFRWMTSGSNEETISKAKKMIGNATIGLVIIIMAYAITMFVFDVLLN